MIKRSAYTKAFPGHWGMPGGRADGDETPEQAVVREVKEETGLSFQPEKLVWGGSGKTASCFGFMDLGRAS